MSPSPDAPDLDRRIAAAVDDLLDARAAGATICPSEAARRVAGDDGDWRALMDPVRAVVGDLVGQGRVEVTQGGEVVDLATARGPIRVRRAR
ncbi:DUF3253 domain-containing protein [Nocardioides sp. ChNu-153]|uniref:DUF3253 domain-containing protein n=1 Tax=unclassified Nocardioides TaxID=2615069 RepID=UPI002405B1CB|nr:MULTISPECIES: DUF3253 domain-containing protein [unclassified Nocardioides]MDF9716070.1 DUF3253 domain-containing protein [Nocardioides sp. ChNu-99]MDN7120346.1 DUF3253 domain-containing protein [Nocardioides sp. ChNu-153]